MSISTVNQRVDQDSYDKGYNRTFGKRRKQRPGKTTYVLDKHGCVTVKGSEPTFFLDVDPAKGADYTSVIKSLPLQALGK